MESITVTIGRNVGDTPMPTTDWRAYLRSVHKALTDATEELWVDADYVGRWGDVPEQAHVDVGPLVDHDRLPALRSALSAAATRYHQDAVGLSVGTAELVASDTVRAA
jgi:hypothetical protein